MKGMAFALGLAGMLSAIPVAAHHSFDSAFDRNRTVKLSGRVTEFQFINPHSFIMLAVTGPNGQTQEWHVETTSAGSLAANGWTAQSIKAGEELKVEGWPARNGTHYARLSSMRHADGSAVALWMPPGPTPLPGG
uniref:DUF6152 family protein n=1 Tax=Altererythrobacter segetis TaxID=1104773 RepID=UPI00140CF0A2|nr:DUF6152 family protein [Altererythrobacter segetis]